MNIAKTKHGEWSVAVTQELIKQAIIAGDVITTGKDGHYVILAWKADGTPLPTDEPLFVLRAWDPGAAPAIRQYANLMRDVIGESGYEACIARAKEVEEYDEQRMPGSSVVNGIDSAIQAKLL